MIISYRDCPLRLQMCDNCVQFVLMRSQFTLFTSLLNFQLRLQCLQLMEVLLVDAISCDLALVLQRSDLLVALLHPMMPS